MGANLKRKISDIITPAANEVLVKRTFISHARHLKASYKLISDMWCIVQKRSHETLGDTTQIRLRLAILPLARRYRADRVSA